MAKRYTLTLPNLWQRVREVRKTVIDALADCSADVRDASAMTASELVENAVKYGESTPKAQDIAFTLTVDPAFVRIEVVNGLFAEASYLKLQAQIDQIMAAPDREALFMARLNAMLTNVQDRDKLGLYRIGHEGKFDLASTYQEQVLTVTATRGIG